ncbi:MAG: DUF5666 domain-containing protein, partial [Blastocatellia bacterium]
DQGMLQCPLEAVDLANGTITMLNMRIRITAQTVFSKGGPGSIDQLTVGSVLQVSFQNTGNGPVASHIS